MENRRRIMQSSFFQNGEFTRANVLGLGMGASVVTRELQDMEDENLITARQGFGGGRVYCALPDLMLRKAWRTCFIPEVDDCRIGLYSVRTS